jgi:nucleosome binding factor SPN SPT16 subunit
LTWLAQEQEAYYNVLLGLQAEMLSSMTDGTSARDIYQRALDYVREKKPELEKHFPKTIGFGVGIFLFLVSVQG